MPHTRLKSAVCLLYIAALGRPLAAMDAAAEITIHLYDYAGMAPRATMDAQRAAEAVLRQAGLEVRWRSCPVTVSLAASGPGCGSATDDVTHFVVGVLPERMARRIASGVLQFGASVLRREGGFPTHAYVFQDRVMQFAEGESVPWPSLLGTIIAHEIGHLLLGNDSHCPAGIMSAQWRHAEVKRALMGCLTFTPQQAVQMRADVRRRIRRGGSSSEPSDLWSVVER